MDRKRRDAEERLVSQLSRLGELHVDAGQGITYVDRERQDAEERLEKVIMELAETRFENSRDMAIRTHGLAVFDFILQAAACTSFSLHSRLLVILTGKLRKGMMQQLEEETQQDNGTYD